MLAASYEHNIKATAGEEQAHESGKGRRIKRDQRRSDQIVADRRAPPQGDQQRVGQMRDAEPDHRSEEHTSELQSLMRISYAVFCLKKKNTNKHEHAQKKETINTQTAEYQKLKRH